MSRNTTPPMTSRFVTPSLLFLTNGAFEDKGVNEMVTPGVDSIPWQKCLFYTNVLLLQKRDFISIERKSSALIPPSPTMKAALGENSFLKFSNPSLLSDILLF